MLPLNTEQRQAVVQGLSAPLTVVTGPPGTGKSQVVTSLLANMAWQGGSVLFASKNNHAVDVVESRANDLGPHPLLLRLGKEEHHARLAQHLTAALAESASPDDRGGVCVAGAGARGERAPLRGGAAARSRRWSSCAIAVDELERAAEPARAMFGAERFAALRALDADGIRARLAGARGCARSAREGASRDGRMLQSRRAQASGGGWPANCSPTRNGSAWSSPARRRDHLEAWDEFHRALARSCWNGRRGRRRTGRRWSGCGAATAARGAGARTDPDRRGVRAQFARAVAALAAPVAQPLESGAAQSCSASTCRCCR